MKIPKKFHSIWVHGSPENQWEHFNQGWMYHHPGWQHVNWFAGTAPINRKEFDSVSDLRIKANILKYEILLTHGGVVIDQDFECLRCIEPLIGGADLFSATEDGKHVSVGILGCCQWDPFMSKVVENVPAAIAAGDRCGVSFFTEMVNLYKPDISIFPPELFYPYTGTDLRFGRTVDSMKPFPGAYAVHHWAALQDRFGEALT